MPPIRISSLERFRRPEFRLERLDGLRPGAVVHGAHTEMVWVLLSTDAETEPGRTIFYWIRDDGYIGSAIDDDHEEYWVYA